MVKNLQKQSKKKKKRKKEQNFSSFVRLHNKRTKRERKQRREKKKMRENTINDKQMTTRERQQIEVAKLERELNALKVDAFAKVRCCFFFFVTLLRNSFRRHHHHFRWVCVLNRDDEISYRSRSVRCLLGFQRQQQPAKSPNAFTSARAAAEE